MATKKFDSLFENLLNELSPVTADYETFGSSLKGAIDTAPGKGYLIGNIADSLGKSKQEVVDMISQSLFDKVFGKYENNTNPAKNEDQYRNAIKSALVEIINDLKAQNPDMKVPGADAVKGYTARVISQLATAEKDYSSGVQAASQEVEKAVEDASEESVENGAPAEPKAPKAARYLDEAEYEILTPEEMSEAGVELSDDLKTYYSRVENIADQVQKGKDLVKAIQRGGTDVGSATKAASALIRAGAIKYASAANSDQDVEALEREDGDIEEIGRKEFEKSFGKAYKDYMASQPGAMNIGFED
jgi:vacuolar-type H+-ATPase subunit H